MSISINNDEASYHAGPGPSLRRRLISSAAAPEVALKPDGSDTINLASTDESDVATDSAGEGTSSDVDNGYVVGKRKGGEEGRKGESAVKGEEGDDRSGKGDGPLPATYVYRAWAPAHNRVKESPLSSDAIFKQSYAGTCKDKGENSSDRPNFDYLYGVSLRSLAYFIMAPTLCYQLSYPRTTCIRRGWLIRQFIKLVIFTGFMGFIIEQYVNPIIKNSEHPLKGNFLNAIERVLRLSLPVLYVWLCMFYCFFHLWLNILGELLCFGDREFYKDWWNAKTIEEVGNMIFWFFFCIFGQPMCVLLYYHEMMNRNVITD